MPFKSKSQQRFFFAAEKEGKLPQGTARRWAKETKEQGIDMKKLPEKTEQEKVAAVATALQKLATVGVTTTSAMSGVKSALPKPGKLNAPKRMIVGTARGFKPGASLDGPKDPQRN